MPPEDNCMAEAYLPSCNPGENSQPNKAYKYALPLLPEGGIVPYTLPPESTHSQKKKPPKEQKNLTKKQKWGLKTLSPITDIAIIMHRSRWGTGVMEHMGNGAHSGCIQWI